MESRILLVGYDDQIGGGPLLTVGERRINGTIDIINAYVGDKAVDIYKSLTTLNPEIEKGEANGESKGDCVSGAAIHE